MENFKLTPQINSGNVFMVQTNSLEFGLMTKFSSKPHKSPNYYFMQDRKVIYCTTSMLKERLLSKKCYTGCHCNKDGALRCGLDKQISRVQQTLRILTRRTEAFLEAHSDTLLRHVGFSSVHAQVCGLQVATIID